MMSLQDLRGRRLAIHALHTAPGWLCRIPLRRNGINPEGDVISIIRPPDDYGMHLRGPREGSTDAAMVGSTMAITGFSAGTPSMRSVVTTSSSSRRGRGAWRANHIRRG